MTKKRDLIAEIEEIRRRQHPLSHPVAIPFRMIMIARAFRSSPALDSEFLRYVPIATIACVEGFFRSAVKELIDAGGQFAKNARHLSQIRDLRADFDILDAVHGRRISIGELFAHLASFNRLSQIEAIMSTIIGSSFLELLKSVHDRWDVEVKGKPQKPIITEPEVVLKHMDEMFRLRHIYAHEVIARDELDRATVGEALESSVSFLNAAAEVVGELLHPNAPLTQADMNQQSARDLAVLDGKIEAVLEELSSLVEDDRRELLYAGQAAWLEFRRRQAEYAASIYRGGTIYPVIYGGAERSLGEERLESLKKLLEQERENP